MPTRTRKALASLRSSQKNETRNIDRFLGFRAVNARVVKIRTDCVKVAINIVGGRSCPGHPQLGVAGRAGDGLAVAVALHAELILATWADHLGQQLADDVETHFSDSLVGH